MPALPSARVVGFVRGREINRDATAEAAHDALVLHWASAAPWRLSYDGIDGVTFGPSSLTLYLAGDDVLELSGDESLRTLALQVLDHAAAMPEVTRGLRFLGAARDDLYTDPDGGSGRSEQERWFAPLLAVRRAVEGVTDPVRQVALMDAVTLQQAFERVLTELAATRRPDNAAAQRALEAALEEEAEGVILALRRVHVAGEAVRGSADDSRLADWRRWVVAVKLMFSAADESWERMRAILGAA